MERSIESHNAIASIDASEVSPFLDNVVEHGKDTALTALREVLNGEIAKLGIDSNPNDILTLRARLGFFVAMAKELKARLDEEVLLAWLIKHGELEVGEVRLYAGIEKTTKLAAPMAVAVEKLMEATGGDMARLCELFSTSAIKPGACKKVLSEDEWNTMFRVEEVSDVKEGKPKRKVVEFNPKFVR